MHCHGDCTYGEHDGDATADSFGARQVGLLAQPQVLRLAAIALPARHGSSKQQHLNALSGGQRSNHLLAAALSDNVYLSSGCGRLGCAQSTWTVGAVDHCAGVLVVALGVAVCWSLVGRRDSFYEFGLLQN